MEASPLLTSDTQNWAEQFDRSLHHQRDRVREFLAAQQERLQRVEAELATQLQQLAEELAQSRSQTRQDREEIQQRFEQLSRETETVESLRKEFDTSQSEWEQLQQRAHQQQESLAEQIRSQQDELDARREEHLKRQSETTEAESQLHHDQRALELARAEHEAHRDQLSARQESLQAERAELDARHEQLGTRLGDTESQRRRIAREFKAQHAAALKEHDRHRAELQQREDALAAEAESLQQSCNQLESDLAARSADQAGDSEELGRALAERDVLRVQLSESKDRLAETEQRLSEMPCGGGEGITDEDLPQRYEMAMEDLRELKTKNAELQQRLDQAPASASPASTGGSLDWEAEKQRILNELEDDCDGDDEEQAAERLKIEAVIERTDRVIAEKNREVDELQQLLENQSANVGSVAVGAAALGEVLDSDALVQEERENLKRLQEQWEEKLRKAEIEISVERAKLGRERAELEEKLQAFEEQCGSPDPASDASAESGATRHGRWLKRLGLKDSDEEDG